MRAVEVGLEGEAVLGRRDEATRVARRADSEYAWKPPESVSIACGQRVNACSPPSARDQPRRRAGACRWYVLPRTMRAPGRRDLAGGERLDAALRPDGHERGRLDVAVRRRRGRRARACPSRASDAEGEAAACGGVNARPSQSSIASPYEKNR